MTGEALLPWLAGRDRPDPTGRRPARVWASDVPSSTPRAATCTAPVSSTCRRAAVGPPPRPGAADVEVLLANADGARGPDARAVRVHLDHRRPGRDRGDGAAEPAERLAARPGWSHRLRDRRLPPPPGSRVAGARARRTPGRRSWARPGAGHLRRRQRGLGRDHRARRRGPGGRPGRQAALLDRRAGRGGETSQPGPGQVRSGRRGGRTAPPA